MIRIASPERITLSATEINSLQSDADRRRYVFDRTSFYVTDTRLKDIELRINFENPNDRPDGLFLYYFQQIGASQTEPLNLALRQENPIIIRVEEGDFWKHKPLYVDKIGILAYRIQNDCIITVEAFKIL